ncbi:MAG: T9SS C-terminal target domain-containing protein, partial [Deltaproteobacteria bacterium]
RQVDFQPLKRLALYPNPASEAVRILTDDWAGLPATITLVDASGRIVVQRDVEGLDPAFETVDVRTVPNGQYFMHIMVEGHKPVSEGLVIHH